MCESEVTVNEADNNVQINRPFSFVFLVCISSHLSHLSEKKHADDVIETRSTPKRK